MMLLAALVLAQAATPPPPCPGGDAECKPWERYQKPGPSDDLIPKGFHAVYPVERLWPGPHTLIVSDGQALTRIDYKTGAACKKARDETRRQVAPPADTRGIIYGAPRLKAFCVPR